ncbi:hypothetical protein C8F04DRAFT_1185213 [Mycena alexandri]|uniref:Uncharacterized protein n=1 Tax=Mycena alexandri TaxID=1745969 RepID=A0AAD6STA9_9AGAR|nr:hypothetical protein C8F04DRAFT_1185213 [Mycena alexandri]
MAVALGTESVVTTTAATGDEDGGEGGGEGGGRRRGSGHRPPYRHSRIYFAPPIARAPRHLVLARHRVSNCVGKLTQPRSSNAATSEPLLFLTITLMFSTNFAGTYTPEQLMMLVRERHEASSGVPREALDHNSRRQSGGTLVARDSHIAADARQTLFCGSEQPFTTGHLNQATSCVDTLSASLGIQNSPAEREQLARKSNGCGTQIHRAASPDIWVWNADATGVSDTVVPLEDQYVPREAAAELEAPHREACGCLTQFVGCAVCGNPLGSRLAPCQMHILPHWSGVYTFLPSAVSPPLSGFTPAPTPAEREREPLTERVAEHLRSRANYAPDGRRIPREPPTLRRPAPDLSDTDTTRAFVRASLRRTETADIEEEWVAAHERAVAAAGPPRRSVFPPRPHRLPSSFSEDAYRAVLLGERVSAPNTPNAPSPAITPTSVARDRDPLTVQFASVTGTESNSDSWSLFEPDGSLRLPSQSTDTQHQMMLEEQRRRVHMAVEQQRQMRVVQAQRMQAVEVEVDPRSRSRQEALMRAHQDERALSALRTQYRDQLRQQQPPNPVNPPPQQSQAPSQQQHPIRPRVARMTTAGAGSTRGQITAELPTGATTRVLRVGRASESAARVSERAGDGGAGAGSGTRRMHIQAGSVDTVLVSDSEDEFVVLRRV